ncbi:hypothetical protein B4100_0655 [Heyndrickxia coagulans]|jgi:hypothetical protein|nr:hypothetical protein B4100_0655 [Heyndrickxia coagulans]
MNAGLHLIRLMTVSHLSRMAYKSFLAGPEGPVLQRFAQMLEKTPHGHTFGKMISSLSRFLELLPFSRP